VVAHHRATTPELALSTRNSWAAMFVLALRHGYVTPLAEQDCRSLM
jgi:hypothetical protein